MSQALVTKNAFAYQLQNAVIAFNYRLFITQQCWDGEELLYVMYFLGTVIKPFSATERQTAKLQNNKNIREDTIFTRVLYPHSALKKICAKYTKNFCENAI